MTARTLGAALGDHTLTGGSWMERREILKTITAAGIGSAVFARALVALAEEAGAITAEKIAQAEWISGLSLTDDQRKLMLKDLNDQITSFGKTRAVALDNAVAPAIRVDILQGKPVPATGKGAVRMIEDGAAVRPSSDDELAFSPVTTLARLLRKKKVSSVELARLYLARLRLFDPVLKCVVTLTEDLAMKQAGAADREIAAGKWRGPLHGVPWVAKDLLAVPGYPTTWGATPFKTQVRPDKATVVSKLEEAGAVLLAKTTVGELAWGDVWFGGTTKNPWKTDQGSSGSSAGSASSTAAGITGFAIGTETWGSIVSPSTRCGATGLRPTFGRISRAGAMALAWSMDKIGPIARAVEDCALVFAAIHGPDGLDVCVADGPFDWPHAGDVKKLRVGVVQDLFDEDYTKMADPDEDKKGYTEWQENDRRSLAALKDMGLNLIPVKLPADLPVSALSLILSAEAATCFDELTRTGRDATLVRQVADAWPTVFRLGQMVPAVEYLRANRIRTLLMREMETLFESIDVYVVPSFGGDNLLRTNLTGHPCVVLPNGFRTDGTPTSLTFQGRLFGETPLLALARAYQEATGFHLKHPTVAVPG